jgi:5-methylthioadenosine/S-adenosylhomocysteine deaminase
MSSSSKPKILTARWVAPVSSEPVAEAAVLIDRGVIEMVGERSTVMAASPQADVHDYGKAIITPGLINLHTHLDYTLLRHVDTDSDMFLWLRSLVSGSRQFRAEDWLHSALQGASEVALSGTTCVADSSYRGAAAEAAVLVGLRAVVGLELFGIDQSRAETIWQEWLSKFAALRQRLAQLEQATGAFDEGVEGSAASASRVTLTVAPHAPYTVAPPLWRRARQWAEKAGLPVLCHLAESKAESDFLSGAGDEIIGYLSWVYAQEVADVHTWTAWRRHAGSPVEYASQKELLHRGLVAAHAIHLSAPDIELFRQAGCGIAHCPRSSARLRNGFAPVSRFVESKVPFGFGTDSAASTADLSVLHEARFSLHALRLLQSESRVASQAFFHHLTLGAAQVLGLESLTGSLEAGKVADIAVFAIDHLISGAALERPYEILMHGGVRAEDVFVNGEPIVVKGALARHLPLPVAAKAIAASGS